MPHIDEEYDVAVAYSAPYTSIESFVINNVRAKKKFMNRLFSIIISRLYG